MENIKFEVIEKIGVLSKNSSGWTKELRLVSWNDKPAKYEIREWSPDGQKCNKGITFTDEEYKELKKLLSVV